MATGSGSMRASRTPSRPDATPMLTCGSIKVACSEAIGDVRSRDEVHSRTACDAIDRADDRLGHLQPRRRRLLRRVPLSHRAQDRLALIVDARRVLHVVVGGLVDVGADAQCTAGAGNDHRPDSCELSISAYAIGKLCDHLVVDRVEDLRSVQRHTRGVAPNLDLDRVVVVTGQPLSKTVVARAGSPGCRGIARSTAATHRGSAGAAACRRRRSSATASRWRRRCRAPPPP